MIFYRITLCHIILHYIILCYNLRFYSIMLYHAAAGAAGTVRDTGVCEQKHSG